MENTGFKGLAKTFYQRVVLSYKTTLIGLAVVAGGVIVENLTHSPNKVVSTIGLVVGGVFALVKEQLPKPPAEG